MSKQEKLREDVERSLKMALKFTGTSSLEELDNLIQGIKKEQFLGFLHQTTQNLDPEQKSRVARFLATRRSALDMIRSEK
jgi:hypothetical protein